MKNEQVVNAIVVFFVIMILIIMLANVYSGGILVEMKVVEDILEKGLKVFDGL